MGYRRTITVEFEGGKAAKSLKRVGAKLEIGMGTVTRKVTSGAVRGATQRGGQLGGVHRHILPGISARQNNIRLDPRRAPAVFGGVFGGGRRPTTQQFPPWRGSGRDAGYLIYPDLRDQEDQIDRLVVELIDKAL